MFYKIIRANLFNNNTTKCITKCKNQKKYMIDKNYKDHIVTDISNL